MLSNPDKKRQADFLFENVKNNGDQDSFRKLFSIYFSRLNDFAKHVVKDNDISQDIVQDVFVKLWEHKNKFHSENIEALLYKMVRNKCIDFIKHIRLIDNKKYEFQISTQVEELYRIDFVGDEPYVLIEEELKKEIEKIIGSLPERCREVFVFSRIKGLKNKEIANLLNINIKNVERHISHALKIFRERFPEDIPLALIVLVLRNML